MALFVFFTGCEEIQPDSPEISWISGGTSMSYAYSGGVISGYYFYRDFTVLGDDGEVTVQVCIPGDENAIVTGTCAVEAGKEYTAKVKGTRAGSEASSYGITCLTVEFSSPNCRTIQEIDVDSYSINQVWYCPVTLSFGEVSIEE